VNHHAAMVIRLGLEADFDGLTEEMAEAFGDCFVAACKCLEGAFVAWDAIGEDDEEDEDLDPDAISKLTEILTEFGKSEEVEGAPV
jgi:hypothetical protein